MPAFSITNSQKSEQSPEDALNQLLQSKSETLQPLIRKLSHTVQVLNNCLTEFGETGLSLSFNGGKDCTLLLFIYCAILSRFNKLNSITRPIKCLYITCIDPFTEVDEFVDYCAQRYNLDVMKLLGSMKDGLKVYLNSNPKVKAIIIGTRKGDPFSEKMITQQPTDGDWPYVIRIHPILDWTYKDVWMAIRELNIPYCTLYDIGYTSLGSISNTLPNPLLINPNTPSGYDPAYLLNDESAERNGRVKK
ncbi:hypothetical protein BC833DRAFT_600787 [Globomyces pollinis-pini]|nr:hypothetical protein BC833DRAFT_600787 [Globomyces pollinis-pini]